MSYVTTGSGEVALMNVSPVHSSAAAQQSQFPTTLFFSSGPKFSRLSSMQPQPHYEPRVQTRERNPNTRQRSIPAKENMQPRNKFIKDFFLTVFGMMICAIPLAIISTLYVEQHAAASSSSTSTSTIVTTAGNISATNFTLPSQCTSYITNNDSTRNVAAGMGASCDNTLTIGWYRFMGGAGTQLATIAVSRDTCTTWYGGSYNGSLPLTVGSTTLGTLCANNNGVLCDTAHSGSLIQVTNCSGYYVYYLSPIPTVNCNSRYCTTF